MNVVIDGLKNSNKIQAQYKNHANNGSRAEAGENIVQRPAALSMYKHWKVLFFPKEITISEEVLLKWRS